jgi:hypothetical protein
MTIALGNVTTSAANVYASSGNTVVTFLSLTNYSASNVTANVFVVPSGSSAGNATILFQNLDLTIGETYQIYAGNEKLILGNNDAIQANSSANSSVTTIVSYTSA